MARSAARWITGPSAMGSENGTPSSITSAPASTSAFIRGSVAAGDGSPAAIYGISAAARPDSAVRAKAAAMRSVRVVMF
ncbi:hypothetical protein G6F68_021019 [Rhizopus microsporus]|nr:hypothetical protein G6F68_021019 [Rhizopus microsporus]